MAVPAAPLALLLHPGLLALGAGLAAVPLVIHLLSRRRVRPLRWAAMRWLLAALQKHQRRLRMENLLVLLLRMAAVALLGLGVARLVLTDSTLLALARPKRSVVLLLDTSASTGARDGARSVSDRVRVEAERVLDSLGSDDALAVVVSNDVRPDRTGTRPFLLVPRAVGREGVARAKEALGLLRPTEAPAAWDAALAEAAPRKVLAPEDVNRSLVWVTDLQAVDWRPPEAADRADPLRTALEAIVRDRDAPTIEVVDVGGSGARTLPNLAVTDVRVEGGDLFQGHDLRLGATVSNEGPAEVDGAVLRVFLDDAVTPVKTVRVPRLRGADLVTLKADAREVSVAVERALAFATPGAHAVRVEVAPPESSASADALAVDSRRFLAVDVRSTLKVLAWTEPCAQARADPLDLLKGVYTGEGSGDVFSLRSASGEDEFRRLLASYEPDLVVLANRVPGGAETQRDLVAWVRAGGALLAFAGDKFDAATWNAAFHARKETRLSPFRYDRREVRDRGDLRGPFYLDLEAWTPHPLSERWLKDPAVRAWLLKVMPRIWGRFWLLPPEPTTSRAVTPVPAVAPGEDAVVVRFAKAGGEGSTAAVVEAPFGQGRVLCVATGLDDAWMDQGIVLFLPVLLYDSALLLTRPADASRNVLVGQSLQCRVPRDATNLRVRGPGRGEEAPGLRAAQDENELPTAVFERVGASGLWRLAYDRPAGRGGEARRAEEVFAANVDPREGSLARAAHDLVRARVPGVEKDKEIRVLSTYEDAAAKRVEARGGEVTPWILLAVALVLLLEPWLAMRFGRHGHTTAAGGRAT